MLFNYNCIDRTGSASERHILKDLDGKTAHEFKFLSIGHRGARGHEPENTLRGIRKGLELGANGIEIDVQFAADELLVFHDPRLERTTNGKGELASHSLTHIRSLDAGQGEKIPLLSEVLNEVRGKALLQIEIKGKGVPEPLAIALKKELDGSPWYSENLIVSSFDHRELKKFSALMPSVRIGALLYGSPLSLCEAATKLGAYSVHLDQKFLDLEMIADARARGVKVYVYTVNESEDIKRVISFGVDGIFSDYPERVLQEFQ